MTNFQFWAGVYIAVGFAALAWTFFNLEFLEGTPVWKKGLSMVFIVLLWPLFMGVLIISGGP